MVIHTFFSSLSCWMCVRFCLDSPHFCIEFRFFFTFLSRLASFWIQVRARRVSMFSLCSDSECWPIASISKMRICRNLTKKKSLCRFVYYTLLIIIRVLNSAIDRCLDKFALQFSEKLKKIEYEFSSQTEKRPQRLHSNAYHWIFHRKSNTHWSMFFSFNCV